MTIVDVLEQNSRSYGDEVCLVESVWWRLTRRSKRSGGLPGRNMN